MGKTATQVLFALGALVGGGALGAGAARWAGGGSGMALVFSIIALPAGYLLGMYAWFWIGFAGAIIHFFSGGRWPPETRVDGQIVPSGAWAFPVTCCAAGGLAGLLAGLAPGAPGPLTVAVAYAIGGALWGRLLRRLAETGRLLIPEPE